jgi:cardiolipin synthase
MTNSHYIALGIFLIAGITDVLDGYIARKYNLISKVGIVMDPFADKLMQLTALASLAISEAMPLWLFIVFMAKEFFMIISGSILYWRKEKVVIPSNIIGKSATVVSTIAVTLLIIFPSNVICISVLIMALVLKLLALTTYVITYKNRPTS